MADTPPEVRLFVAAYEERSFTGAAQREGATQSGVSQHIRKLEARFGARLFHRDAAGITPTPAGDAYYWRCLDVLRAHAEAATSLRGFGQGFEGEIRVGLMPTMTRCALAPALAGFVLQHPNLHVRVVEAYSASLVGQVREGALDFAVVPAFSDTAGLRVRPFAQTPELLVSTAGGKHLAAVRLAELPPLSLVLPGRANTRRQTIETYCASNGVAVARTLELDSMLATLDLAATTAWVAVLPGMMMARDHASGRFTLNPLADPALTLTLVAIEKLSRPLPEAAVAFAEALEATTNAANFPLPPGEGQSEGDTADTERRSG